MDVRKMGIVSAFVVVVMMMLSMQEGAMAFREFKVGDAQAWHVPDGNNVSFYEEWASPKRFHVGDTLRFEYKNDSVLAVDKYSYYHCNTSSATSTYNDGNTIIKLEHPGSVYFISGTVEHCQAGQKLEVDVMFHNRPPVAKPPVAHDVHHAVSPSPSPSTKKNSGSQLVAQVSSIFGLVVAASLLL